MKRLVRESYLYFGYCKDRIFILWAQGENYNRRWGFSYFGMGKRDFEKTLRKAIVKYYPTTNNHT